MTTTRVCVAGGGPAGIMLGLLLARHGIDVVVLEKHDDFFRDFRGDTVHPSTMNLLDALGLRAGFDAIPHHPLTMLDVVANGVRVHAVDFTTLPRPNNFLTLMPQWDLLDLLASEGARHPSFDLRMGTEVIDVLHDAGRVSGVRVRDSDGESKVRADLVIAADGRDSTVRRRVGLRPAARGVPADVVWFRLPHPSRHVPDTLAWLSEAGMLITIPRPDYLQCGFLIPKGRFDDMRAEGIERFRARVARGSPPLTEVTDHIVSFDDVKLLSVQIDRLPTWTAPGVLCIGDSAHAMSPAFGVGINYAVQDAVAAARILVPVLTRGGGHAEIDRAAARVQRRRAWPTAMMQRIQQVVHRAIANGRAVRVLDNPPTRAQRAVMRVAIPVARPLVARMVGYGFRPERLSG
ncbi:FAD-dependent oxidoreductase [Microbacterium awajiense]|uniref:FAD-dependent oxidoreductase n=1 Tax=Microbacterium awajiense TaxID=415214 RepID=A0ABP7AJT0_9MICO